MKEFLKNNYHKHLIIGALIGVFVSIGLHLFNYNDTSINLACGAFIGLFAGVIWEGEQTFRYKNKWDLMDVIYSGIGSLIGSIIITLIF